MKKIKNAIGLILMYLGAWLQGYKYILIIGIVLVTILEGCKTQRDGCGSYSAWEQRHSKFNK